MAAMSDDYGTDQEALWAGEFGTEYVERNRGADLVAANTALFRRVLEHTSGVSSVLELGCNIGNNLRALRGLLPDADLLGVEINDTAAAEVREWGGAEVEVGSILGYRAERTFDLTFTKGVLIHINPDRVGEVYEALTQASSRYVMVCEYYNPTPVEVRYRGKDAALFKGACACASCAHLRDPAQIVPAWPRWSRRLPVP